MGRMVRVEAHNRFFINIDGRDVANLPRGSAVEYALTSPTLEAIECFLTKPLLRQIDELKEQLRQQNVQHEALLKNIAAPPATSRTEPVVLVTGRDGWLFFHDNPKAPARVRASALQAVFFEWAGRVREDESLEGEPDYFTTLDEALLMKADRDGVDRDDLDESNAFYVVRLTVNGDGEILTYDHVTDGLEMSFEDFVAQFNRELDAALNPAPVPF